MHSIPSFPFFMFWSTGTRLAPPAVKEAYCIPRKCRTYTLLWNWQHAEAVFNATSLPNGSDERQQSGQIKLAVGLSLGGVWVQHVRIFSLKITDNNFDLMSQTLVFFFIKPPCIWEGDIPSTGLTYLGWCWLMPTSHALCLSCLHLYLHCSRVRVMVEATADCELYGQLN